MHTTWIIMSFTDAVLILLLAARIHGTDEAVRACAKRCIKKIPRKDRSLIHEIIRSRQPLDMAYVLAEQWTANAPD